MFASFASFLLAVSVGLSSGAPDPQARATAAGYEQLRGFATVLVTHLNRALGTEHLPPFVGAPVTPGLIVTADPSRVQLFDRFAVPLSAGRVSPPEPSPECASKCPKILFDTFRRWWFELGVESRTHAVEVPDVVLIGAHRDLPAQTLTQIAYAASESRPIQPPRLMLLTHGGPAGVRGIPFYLVRPGGLTLPPNSAALGLTVTIEPGRFVVTAAARSFGRTLSATSVPELVAILKDVHRHHPNKAAIVYRFSGDVSVGNFVATYAAVREEFPVAVLGDDEPITIP
ncbi:MAG: hypothetical protein D6705_17925 [Deltaproteobacteria bacterium]|nr:MAG: hypothetical protein D6705_17925 [Deltaproteobacteria bacterium]